MENSDVEERRRFRRIQLSEDAGVYCIIIRPRTGHKTSTITLNTLDYSEQGIKFTILSDINNYLPDEPLYLKAIVGSRNIMFADPIELSIKSINKRENSFQADVGCEIVANASESVKKFKKFIISELLFCGRNTLSTKPASTMEKESDAGQVASLDTGSKILAIYGGPRRAGNISKILDWIEDELRKKGHLIERIDLSFRDVNGCLGCLKCKTMKNEPGCFQNDDAPGVIDKMVSSALTIFAAPIYYPGFNAQMKAFLDRCNCLFRGARGTIEHLSFIEGKRQALIATTEGSFENNAEPVLTSFKNLLACSKTLSAGAFIVCNCSRPEELKDEVEAHARRFANQLFGSTKAAYPVLIPGIPTII